MPKPLERPGRGLARKGVDRQLSSARHLLSAGAGQAAALGHTSTVGSTSSPPEEDGASQGPRTANPADIFTKHSHSRDKLANLVSLFDCFYAGGRAASAPELRRETGAKVTMAQADERMAGAIEKGDDTEGGEPTIMPHKMFDLTELDALYPALATTDGADEDVEPQPADPLLAEGERIATTIQDESRRYGRTARAVLFDGGADVTSMANPDRVA